MASEKEKLRHMHVCIDYCARAVDNLETGLSELKRKNASPETSQCKKMRTLSGACQALLTEVEEAAEEMRRKNKEARNTFKIPAYEAGASRRGREQKVEDEFKQFLNYGASSL
jgi:hypothetical protein